MNVKLNDIDIKGLDGLEYEIMEEYNAISFVSKFASLIPLSIFLFIFILSGASDITELFVTMCFSSFSLYFLFHFLFVEDAKEEKNDKLNELNKVKSTKIKEITYKISNNRVYVYLDGIASKFIYSIEFCNIDKPLLDFKNGVLKLRLEGVN